MNRFDPIAHKYYIDEVEVPSITQVLKEIGAVNDFWYNEAGRERGVGIHFGCNAIIRKAPYVANPAYVGYYEAFEKFLKETGFVPDVELCEKPLFHTKLLFGGTPDLVGTINSINEPWAVIDIKTGEPGYATRFQTAAQAILLNRTPLSAPPFKRFSLRLRESGVLKLERDVVEYADPKDYERFLNALDLIHDRRNYEKEKQK